MARDFSDTVWPGWNVAGILGNGSYGRVYKIERDVVGHTEKAALKVISIPQNDGEIEELYNDGYDSESITRRFKSHLQDIVREYSLMSEMKGHSNIVYCEDLRCVQHDDGMGWDIYIKMELLTPLPKILKNGFSEKLVIKLGLDICNALILCKSKNIVHRDIKPQNIFVSEDRNFKLGDFGIAKTAERTTSGTKTGTYKYMAPEVYNNQPYGHAADIYSLGMVLYWLLNERRTPFLPLPPQTPTATDEERARDSRFAGFSIPEPAHGSDELKRIVLKACAFSPEDRYKNAAEMRNDLLALARGGSYTVQNPHIKSPTKKEPPMRAPVPDTDETVGNFGRVQKEKTPTEETVGVFSHNAAGGNKGRNRSKSVINNINPASRKKTWIAIAVAIVAALALITTGVSIGKRSLSKETVDIETTLNATVASGYNHPDELIGKWYALFGINDIISDLDWAVYEEYMVISQQNVVYKGMEDYPLEWTADETALHIPAMDDKFEILDVDGICFLRSKTMNLISENDLKNRTGKLFREVNITEDNLFDYFELCTGTVESKDEFGELTGDYERSIYLRPKPQDGYTYWVNTFDEYLDIEIEVPEHDYRVRKPHLNSKGTICSENRKLEFISNYPYKVTELIRAYSGKTMPLAGYTQS